MTRPAHRIVVDVGNTESVVGLFNEGAEEPGRVWRYNTTTPRTADELHLLLQAFLGQVEGGPTLGRAVIGSVVPRQTMLLAEALGRLVQGRIHVIRGGREDEIGLPVRLDVEEPQTVGADRIVNTLAASRLYHEDCIVVDLGTATTYDCITAEGVFLGGVIAPGLQSGQEWLAGRTAKLPRVELAPPARVIGRRTEACIQSGIFYAAVDAVDGIVHRIREEWDRPEARVIATGGLASVIAPHSTTIQRVEASLTLIGLDLAGDYLDGSTLPGEAPSSAGSRFR